MKEILLTCYYSQSEDIDKNVNFWIRFMLKTMNK